MKRAGRGLFLATQAKALAPATSQSIITFRNAPPSLLAFTTRRSFDVRSVPCRCYCVITVIDPVERTESKVRQLEYWASKNPLKPHKLFWVTKTNTEYTLPPSLVDRICKLISIVKGPAHDYEGLVAFLLHHGRPQEAIQLIQTLTDKQDHLIYYNYMIKYYAIRNDKDTLQTVQNHLESEGLMALSTYRSQVAGLAIAGNWEAAFGVIHKAVNKGYAPDLACFNSIANAMVSQGLFARTFDILEKLQDYGLKPDNIILTTLMKAAVSIQNPEQSVRLLMAMESPTPRAVSYALQTCIKARDMNAILDHKLLSVIDYMPTSYELLSLLRISLESRRVDHVIDFLLTFKEKTDIRRILTAIISDWPPPPSEIDDKLVVMLKTLTEKGVNLDKINCSAAIGILLRAGRVDDAIEVADMMRQIPGAHLPVEKEWGGKQPIGTGKGGETSNQNQSKSNAFARVGTAFRQYLSSGNVESAMKTLQLMRKVNFVPYGGGLHQLLDMLKERKDLAGEQQLLAYMKEIEKEVNTKPYSYYINMKIAQTEKLEDALSKIEELREEGFQPDGTTFSTLIKSAKDSKQALEILAMMDEKGWKPLLYGLNKVVNLCCKDSEWDTAFSLVENRMIPLLVGNKDAEITFTTLAFEIQQKHALHQLPRFFKLIKQIDELNLQELEKRRQQQQQQQQQRMGRFYVRPLLQVRSASMLAETSKGDLKAAEILVREMLDMKDRWVALNGETKEAYPPFIPDNLTGVWLIGAWSEQCVRMGKTDDRHLIQRMDAYLADVKRWMVAYRSEGTRKLLISFLKGCQKMTLAASKSRQSEWKKKCANLAVDWLEWMVKELNMQLDMDAIRPVVQTVTQWGDDPAAEKRLVAFVREELGEEVAQQVERLLVSGGREEQEQKQEE